MADSPARLRLSVIALTSALTLAGCAGDQGPDWTPASPPASVTVTVAPSSPGSSGSPVAPASPLVSGSPVASAVTTPIPEPSGCPTPPPTEASPGPSPGCLPTVSPAASPGQSALPSGAPSTTPPSGGLPQGADPVTLDPANFVAEVTHPYWPMPVGAKWTYTEVDAEGEEFRVVLEVLDETKTILGITATVIHDQVTLGGELVEDTMDWYAQDAQGNLWYLGEETAEYENGEVVTTAGSWEAGVDGAQPGIILPADPQVGMAYRQEYLAGEAEDNGLILSISEIVAVATGDYTEVVMTKDTTPLEPDLVEYKWYAPGVGVVLVVAVSPDYSREELIEVEGL